MLSVQRKYVIFALCKKNDGYENTKRIHSSVALARSCLATRLWHSLFAPFWIGCPRAANRTERHWCLRRDGSEAIREASCERLLRASPRMFCRCYPQASHMNSFLLNQIDKEGIYVFWAAVPWKDIKGMRDIIAHHYFDIDAEEVYNIVTEELQPLSQLSKASTTSSATCWMLCVLLQKYDLPRKFL